jgi:hypothetical protein
MDVKRYWAEKLCNKFKKLRGGPSDPGNKTEEFDREVGQSTYGLPAAGSRPISRATTAMNASTAATGLSTTTAKALIKSLASASAAAAQV